MLRTENECINYIHSLKKFGKKAGLSNTLRLLEALGNPQDNLKVVHIAGTNGKGSVSAMVSNILSNKYKVGLYTSPYIEFFNERIQINGEPIDNMSLVEYTNRVKSACESIPDFHPIEFEFITAMGFLYFHEKNCDLVVLETGLGGRFDATNVVKEPLVSAICAIGYDHTAILGDTLEKIAFEKAGIVKKDTPVILYPQMDPKAKKTIEDVALKIGSPCVTAEIPTDIRCDISGTSFSYKNNSYHTSLVGSHQAKNASLAVEIVNSLGLPVSHDEICLGLKTTIWKCRFETIKGRENLFVLDGAHNSHGIDAFCETAQSVLKDISKTIVFGMLNEKDFDKSIEKLARVSDKIIVTNVPSLRQTDGAQIFDAVKKHFPNAFYEEDCRSALVKAKDISNGGAICVLGSLYLVGDLRKFCLEEGEI